MDTRSETRVFPLEEVRIAPPAAAGGRPTFQGLAIAYNRLSERITEGRRTFRERVAPGAGIRHLASGEDVRFLIDHNPLLLLGRTSSGTLELAGASDGIRVRSELPDTSYARDLEALMERGDVRSMSFRFYKPRDSWAQEDGERIRTLSDFGIREVSVVFSPPAYAATEAYLSGERTLASAAAALEELGSGDGLRSAEARASVRSLIAELESLLEEGEGGRPVELARRRLDLRDRDARFRLGLR